MIDAGHARYVGAEEAAWKYTLKGAVAVVAANFKNLARLSKQKEMSQARSKGSVWRGRTEFHRDGTYTVRRRTAEPTSGDAIAEVAADPKARFDLLRAIKHRGVYILAKQTIKPDRTTATQHLTYTQGNQRVMPLFSSAEMAGLFTQSVRGNLNGYECVAVAGLWLAQQTGDVKFVLNPKAPSQTDLSADDLATLRLIAGAT